MNLLEKLKIKFSVAQQYADRKLYWDSLSRQIAPSTIEEYPTYIKINDEILARTVLVGVPPTSDVSGYPADMNPRVIDELLSISTKGYVLGYSFTVIPISNIDSMKMLDEAIYKNRVSQDTYRDKSERPDKNRQPPMKKVLEEQDFSTNYTMLFKNEQKMNHTAFIIIIWGRTEQELREVESHVRIVLESNRIYREFPDYRHLDTFIAAQPYPFWSDFTWTELFSYHTAALMASRNPNSRLSETGLYFGNDLKTNKEIIIDIRALAAQHLMFVGPTGSGKTFTLLMLLMRAYDMLGKRVIYTTPKADVTTNYRSVAEYYGNSATIIDIGAGRKNINPLELFLDENLGENIYTVTTFDDHMELINSFFDVLFGEDKSINQTSYLNESLMECYRTAGISRENPETWKSKKFPTLMDLRTIWIRDSKKESHNKRTAQAFVDKTFMLETSWSYINRPTDINLSADFIIIDISNVPNSLQDAMNVFVTGLMGMRFRTDAKKETIIAVDEGGVFLRNPKLSMFLLRTLTQGRSYNISLWLATQQTADLVKAGVDQEFKTNMSISIVLGNMRRDTMEHVKMFYKLNETDTNNLMSCGVGEGLLMVGNEIIPTKFKPTRQEMEIIKGELMINNINSEIKAVFSELGVKLKNERLNVLASKYRLYFADWLEDDGTILSQYGFEQKVINRPIGQGHTSVWIHSSKLNQNDKIGFESIEHHTSVLYIAGYLLQQGFEVETPQTDVDIIAKLTTEFETKVLSIEFEMANKSTTKFDIVEKKRRAEEKYGNVLFVCTSENYNFLCETVGENNVLRRGKLLKEYIDDLKKM